MRKLPLAAVVWSIASMLIGCRSNQGVVEHLPPPNFSGPVVTAPPAAPPVVARPQASASPPLARSSGPGGERGWIPPTSPREWRWIVIHHSATPAGSAAVFDKMHRDKGWDELGYHFVIGNGTDSGNGQIEVGPRWLKQKWGAHAKTADNRFNDYGIGICLVGNFDIERPTAQQMQSLAKLTAWLMRTYHIPAGNVLGHRDTKPTDCPGRNLNVAQVRRMAAQMLAGSGQVNGQEAAEGLAAGPDSAANPPLSGAAATPVPASLASHASAPDPGSLTHFLKTKMQE
ncbi:peptidoglycan recognition protein family protein [Fontivita pretiosa]|uniref:peptidoglycan recognition protein family protein n=1 Tax=Fontivita pretiosa TaxID=2989684 RepID=UPI003D1853D1